MIPSLENHLFSNLPENTGTYGKRKMSFSLLSVRGQHLEFFIFSLDILCASITKEKNRAKTHSKQRHHSVSDCGGEGSRHFPRICRS